VQRIHALSRGVPRRINLLCDRALLGAYASGAAMVDAAIVDKAAREVLQTRAPKRIRHRRPSSHRWRLPAAIALGVVLGAGLFAAANWMLDTSRSAPAKAAASVPSPPSSPSAK
jgi:general secretion pathway protein A